MSDLERAFIDTAGQTWKKVKASDGRIMRFKDGTPVSKQQWSGAQANIQFEGQSVNVAIPHKGGPGFRRIEVDPIQASALGKELRLARDDVPGQALDQVRLGGETYDLDTIAELNAQIVDKYGPDAVMKY